MPEVCQREIGEAAISHWYSRGMKERIPRFRATQTLHDFQRLVQEVYGIANTRDYSVSDLLIQEQRFAMRTLKGIRKGDPKKTKFNLLITLSWLSSIANLMHIDLQEEIWKRFPNACSYCGKRPCACLAEKPVMRKKRKSTSQPKPQTLAQFQRMFKAIYPPEKRTLTHAGIHLAEEMGEVSEAIYNYLGAHTSEHLNEIPLEIADLVSCIFGVANSLSVDVAKELASMFRRGCHICHKSPCACSFAFVVSLRT